METDDCARACVHVRERCESQKGSERQEKAEIGDWMLWYALRGHNIYVSAHQKHFDRVINYDTAASDSFRQGSSPISDPWADFSSQI